MHNHAPEDFYIRSPRLNQLLILREISTDPNLTQAELARRCGLSVAMVNNYMKELSGLGWLQYRRRSSKSVSYHVTPAGRQQIEAVETDLVHEMAERFAAGKARIRERIFSQSEGMLQRVVLVGSGDLAEMAFHALESAQIAVVGVCDLEPARIGKDWCGRKILDCSQIPYLKPDAVVIADSRFSAEQAGQLKQLFDYGIRVIFLGGRFEGRNGSGSARGHVDPAPAPGDSLGMEPAVKLSS